jgi:hypothetical protein
MYRDNQNKKQMSHVLAHHWWAEIDRLSGQTHKKTLTKNEIADIGHRLNLSEIDFLEFNDPDPVSPAEIARVKRTCEDYLSKARGAANETELIDRGKKLIERIDTIGFAWASLLCVIGRK